MTLVWIVTFVVLQGLDAFTTMTFLHLGVHEGNPLMRLAFSQAHQPVAALVAAKIFAIALAVYAWRTGRRRLLVKMDIFFGACVAWNLIIIAAQR